MFAYYFGLAIHSFRRNVALTILMVLAIAFGVGASMTTLTVLHVLSQDPIPDKSHQLFFVQLDGEPMGPANDYVPGGEPPDQVTRFDAEALLRDAKGDRQAMMTGGNAPIEPDKAGLAPFFVDGRWTSRDFFSMFEVPFVAGQAWTAADDQRAARVAVITRALADKLFGTVSAVGRMVRVSGTELQVVGVLDTWEPAPRFFDLYVDRYGVGEQLFVPMSTANELKLGHAGSMNCWEEVENPLALSAPCEWMQYWVELDSPTKVDAYRQYLVHYAEDQRTAGRFKRPPNARLRDVMQWLEYNKIVPSDVRLQTWIAFGFLLVCLVNTVGLLLTKFLRRSSEIGVRRALGASRRAIFMQLLVEAGGIGLVGGGLGLVLALLGLWAVRHQPTSYAELAQLDLPMLAATFALALGSSLLAGVLPAWRACQVSPAIQLKSH